MVIVVLAEVEHIPSAGILVSEDNAEWIFTALMQNRKKTMMTMKAKQLPFDIPDIYTELRMDREQKKAKRRWEDHFQKWSNEQSEDGHTPEGCCGTGTLCDYCEDNSYGRPCVRALNTLCREKKKQIDYTNYDFKKVWWM